MSLGNQVRYRGRLLLFVQSAIGEAVEILDDALRSEVRSGSIAEVRKMRSTATEASAFRVASKPATGETFECSYPKSERPQARTQGPFAHRRDAHETG